MSNGLMSQAITNVRTAQGQLATVTGLPPAAAAVQSEMIATLETMVPAVQAATAAVLRSAGDEAKQHIDEAEAAIDARDSGALKGALGSLQTLMRSAMSSVSAAITTVDGVVAAITADNQKLANLGTDLAGQIARATAQADEASSAADELDRKKYYFLLLGPFGLPGLAACIALIATTTAKVNAARQHVSEVRAQAAQWKKVEADLELLRHDVPSVANTLQSLKNGLEFLQGDTTQVVADVGKAENSPIARAFVITAKQELAMLCTDAS